MSISNTGVAERQQWAKGVLVNAAPVILAVSGPRMEDEMLSTAPTAPEMMCLARVRVCGCAVVCLWL